MALCNREILRGRGKRDHHRLRMCLRLQIDQALRNENFSFLNEVTDRGTVIKGKKGQNSFTRRKTGECFQWKANGSCSNGESCSFLHESAVETSLHTQEKVVDLA